MHSQIFHSELSTTTKPGIHIANNESRPGDAILLTVPNKAAWLKIQNSFKFILKQYTTKVFNREPKQKWVNQIGISVRLLINV